MNNPDQGIILKYSLISEADPGYVKGGSKIQKGGWVADTTPKKPKNNLT